MSHNHRKGAMTRARIVDACRTTQTFKSLAPLVFIHITSLSKHCRILEAQGWIRITPGNNNNIPITFLTIREESYPCNGEEIIERPNEYTRIIKMENLEKINPDYFKTSLKKCEFMGIESSFSMMEAM